MLYGILEELAYDDMFTSRLSFGTPLDFAAGNLHFAHSTSPSGTIIPFDDEETQQQEQR